MFVSAYGLSNVGKKRTHNEDSYFIDNENKIYLVCDGMGGANAGEVASKMAVEIIAGRIRENIEEIRDLSSQNTFDSKQKIKTIINDAVSEASLRIFEIASREESKKGMGTTLVMLIICGENAFVSSVGDSRAYLIRDNQVYQITEDHTLVQEQLKRGLITPEEAKNVTYGNVITRAVGVMESVMVDTTHIELVAGDIFILCTDGLHGYTEESDILSFTRFNTLEEMTLSAIEFANQKGGKDNITSVFVKVSTELKTEVPASDKIKLMRTVRLFKYCTYQEMIKILSVSTLVSFDKGEIILMENEPGEEFYIILSGEVQVTSNGKLIATLGMGKHFGEMALIDLSPRSASVVTVKPSKLIKIKREDFMALIREDAHLGIKLLWSFLQDLSDRLRITNIELIKHLTN
ncbi:MAG: Stp1/IreP family PP2C-type Ser/Thr phosphatase [Deltaproteobacteria bacterium]|nr:Stp1/IreP family PP2C-type Ser/Thr phosphatase [Deltaproteobacteria bacterium]